jgi:hypothetical protein
MDFAASFAGYSMNSPDIYKKMDYYLDAKYNQLSQYITYDRSNRRLEFLPIAKTLFYDNYNDLVGRTSTFMGV